jgi:arylsulfatase
MAYLFDKANTKAPSARRTQYFEMFGSRAVYHDGWFANTSVEGAPWDSNAKKPPVEDYKWELYNIVADPTQSQNLAAQNPAKLKELQAVFEAEAKINQVYPLDNSTLARLLIKRPGPAAGRTEFVYRGTGLGLTSDAAPSILNRAYTISADFEVPKNGVNGVLAAHGGRFAGYSFYLLDSKPVFAWNLLNVANVKFASPDALTPGKHNVTFSFTPDASGAPVGRGGVGTLSVDGRVVVEQKMPRSIPLYLQWSDGFDVGQDTGTSVIDADYQVPFAFTGKLDNVTFKLGASTMPQPPAPAKTADSGMGATLHD